MRIIKQKNFKLSTGIGRVILIEKNNIQVIYTIRLMHKDLNLESHDLQFNIKEICENEYEISINVFDKYKHELIGRVVYLDEGVIEELINEGTIKDVEHSIKIMTDERELLKDLKYNYSVELQNSNINREERVVEAVNNLNNAMGKFEDIIKR